MLSRRVFLTNTSSDLAGRENVILPVDMTPVFDPRPNVAVHKRRNGSVTIELDLTAAVSGTFEFCFEASAMNLHGFAAPPLDGSDAVVLPTVTRSTSTSGVALEWLAVRARIRIRLLRRHTLIPTPVQCSRE